ncbi:nuclear hormone receptor family member nhr-65-like [Centruroides sculpturatus]|uniref:nuclear hormone receptor family member nhr-65-like n=1 Tax=Centruroides sculpturatus TaxID=218467 RepID=UPI000C6D685B|nr:nuclear hormone receptor family member nhr-65-like [Centruroides sculpturatus]
MTTKEQIEEFRLTRNWSFNPRCVVCGSQYWTSYYGNFGCKRCLRFFLRCVILRKTYKCKYNSGNCRNVYFSAITCKFCYLERMYSYGFRPTRFGRHDDSWYMKDKISSLHPVRVIEEWELRVLPYFQGLTNVRSNLNEFVVYINGKAQEAIEWLIENPPSSDMDLEVFDYNRFRNNASCMLIVKDSLHLHDVLKFRFGYYDPYKIKINGHQYLSLMALTVIRSLHTSAQGDEMSLEMQMRIAYFGEWW